MEKGYKKKSKIVLSKGVKFDLKKSTKKSQILSPVFFLLHIFYLLISLPSNSVKKCGHHNAQSELEKRKLNNVCFFFSRFVFLQNIFVDFYILVLWEIIFVDRQTHIYIYNTKPNVEVEPHLNMACITPLHR